MPSGRPASGPLRWRLWPAWAWRTSSRIGRNPPARRLRWTSTVFRTTGGSPHRRTAAALRHRVERHDPRVMPVTDLAEPRRYWYVDSNTAGRGEL